MSNVEDASSEGENLGSSPPSGKSSSRAFCLWMTWVMKGLPCLFIQHQEARSIASLPGWDASLSQVTPSMPGIPANLLVPNRLSAIILLLTGLSLNGKKFELPSFEDFCLITSVISKPFSKYIFLFMKYLRFQDMNHFEVFFPSSRVFSSPRDLGLDWFIIKERYHYMTVWCKRPILHQGEMRHCKSKASCTRALCRCSSQVLCFVVQLDIAQVLSWCFVGKTCMLSGTTSKDIIMK